MEAGEELHAQRHEDQEQECQQQSRVELREGWVPRGLVSSCLDLTWWQWLFGGGAEGTNSRDDKE